MPLSLHLPIIKSGYKKFTLLYIFMIAVMCCLSTSSVWARMSTDDDVRNPFLRKIPTVGNVSPVVIQPGAIAKKLHPLEHKNQPTTSNLDTPDPTERDPLKLVSLSEIFVIGTITSPHMNIAYVRTNNGYKTPLRSGERAGIEGFTVSRIHSDGVSLRKGEKIIRIPVHNPLIEDIYVNENK